MRHFRLSTKSHVDIFHCAVSHMSKDNIVLMITHAKSVSLLSSMLVWLSPFLYSKLQSSKHILGLTIFRFIFG